MHPTQAAIHNQAIDLAVKAYPKGIGAIKALRLTKAVTVEHVGTTTMQEVVDVDDRA